MDLHQHPLFDMLPDDVKESMSANPDSRMRKQQPPKEAGKEVDPSDLIAEGENQKSAWGMPGAYEVPD